MKIPLLFILIVFLFGCVDTTKYLDTSTQELNMSITGGSTVYRFTTLPQSCVQPTGQNTTVGIYNITNNGTENINVIARINQTFSCFNISLSNTSSCANGLNLTTSNQTLYTNLTVNSSIYLWSFVYGDECLVNSPKFNLTVGAG